MTEDSKKRVNRTPRNKQPRKTGLRDLLSPSYEEARAGIRGITLEQEVVSVEELKARKRRRTAIMGVATIIFLVTVIVLSSLLIARLDPFKKRDFAGDGNGTAVTFVIEQGETPQQIAESLQQQGIIADADKFVEVYQSESKGKFLVPGRYDLQKEMSSSAVVSTLIGATSNVIYFAVPQGKRVGETLDIIAKQGELNRSELEEAVKNYEQYGVPSNFPSIEGWLHPGEYRFPKGTDTKKMIQARVDKTKEDLKSVGVTTDKRAFEVLTKASIVELEAQPKDYNAVAGIIENRLSHTDGETSGLIQSDATVTYGLGIRSYHLTEEQKADKGNKYNTYAHQGLPAGPIDSPTLASIRATASPEKNPYYCWVTVDLDSGETKYSKTYEEHQRYVEEYNQWCSNHKGRCS